jgi:ankyrin repeat protein
MTRSETPADGDFASDLNARPPDPPPLTPQQQLAWQEFDHVARILERGDAGELEELERAVDSFPDGVDPALGRRWITNAVDQGATRAVAWMIQRHVELSSVDDEGSTPLISAIELRDPATRLAMMRLLLAAGARHDAIGLNRWTAAHCAASEGDVEALKLLAAFGADLGMATEDLGSWRTPADAARRHNHVAAIAYLDGWTA